MNETQKLWFKAKRYGYGWYPATWQGWLVLLVYLLAAFAPTLLFESLGRGSIEESEFAGLFIAYMIVITALLILICVRTGEKARWRWGK